MITTHIMPTGSIREIKGKVVYYIHWQDEGDEERTFIVDGGGVGEDKYNDNLIDIKITRQGDNKFFGYGVSQKLEFKRRGRMELNEELNAFKAFFGDGTEEGWVSSCPYFYYDNTTYDEIADESTITAYDGIYLASKHLVKEIEDFDINIWETNAILNRLTKFLRCNSEVKFIGFTDEELINIRMSVHNGNFEGSETIREVLDALAEYEQAIYFINTNNDLVFKRVSKTEDSVTIVEASDYFTLTNDGNKTLNSICSTTSLGDNIIATYDENTTGETQYIRDNGYLSNPNWVAEVLNKAIAAVGGLTISQFKCKWRGNYLLEVGDWIEIYSKNYQTFINAMIINDVITYNGGFIEETEWNFADSENENAASSTIGDAIKETYAKVDKVNKQIELVASEVSSNSEKLATLTVNTDNVIASVTNLEKKATERIDALDEAYLEISEKVAATITSENLTIEVQKQIEDKGVNKITTATGFTFNENGLLIEKLDKEMTTLITEDGMTVYKSGNAMLSANHTGVDAVNLRATTYLIIGTTSRLENYGYDRTGCFWIGG